MGWKRWQAWVTSRVGSPTQALSRLEPLLVAAAFLLLSIPLYWSAFALSMFAEDLSWVRGSDFGYPWRVLQQALLRTVFPTIFGVNMMAYRVPCVLLKVANALLVYQVFVMLVRALGGTFARSRPFLSGGAVAAGLLYLFCDTNAVAYISALSYQLVVLFNLLMIVLGTRYITRPNPLWWGLLVLCYGLGLASHSYAAAVPGFIFMLELCLRRKAGQPWRWRGVVLRYGLLALVLAGYMIYFSGRITGKYQPAFTDWDLLLYYPRFLLYAASSLLTGLVLFHDSFWVQHFFSEYTMGHIPPGWIEGLTLIPILALMVLGGRQLLGRQRAMGLAGGLTVFLFCWCGLTYAQTLSTAGGVSEGHRAGFHCAGVSISVIFVLVSLVHRATAGAEKAVHWMMMVLLVLGLPFGLYWGNRVTRQQLFAARVEMFGRQHHYIWPGSPGCDGLRSVDQDELAPLLARTRDLRCLNLSRLDLVELDLRRVNFTGSNLSWTDFTGADLRGAVMTSANLWFTNLHGAKLHDAKLQRACLVGAKITNAKLVRANLRGANLSFADLTETKLVRADLSEAQLMYADVERCNLAHAVLRSANMTGIQLERSNLHHVNLDLAIMDRARIVNADFKGSDLSRAASTRRMVRKIHPPGPPSRY